MQGITRSLQRLCVPQVDLVQFYWHSYSAKNYVAAAQYLMDEVGRGRVKHVGVTNFDVPRMQEMMDGGVRIAVAQVQCSPLDVFAALQMVIGRLVTSLLHKLLPPQSFHLCCMQ